MGWYRAEIGAGICVASFVMLATSKAAEVPAIRNEEISDKQL